MVQQQAVANAIKKVNDEFAPLVTYQKNYISKLEQDNTGLKSDLKEANSNYEQQLKINDELCSNYEQQLKINDDLSKKMKVIEDQTYAHILFQKKIQENRITKGVFHIFSDCFFNYS